MGLCARYKQERKSEGKGQGRVALQDQKRTGLTVVGVLDGISLSGCLCVRLLGAHVL